MIDGTELILGTLALVLGGAACAVGGRVLRDAWREIFRNADPVPPDQAAIWGRPGSAISPAAPDAVQESRKRIQHR